MPLLAVGASSAAEKPSADVLEFGIYKGGCAKVVESDEAPTGEVLLDGPVRFVKRTTKIPRTNRNPNFDFKFANGGRSDPIRLHLVNFFPEMTQPETGKKCSRFVAPVTAKYGNRDKRMLWDFTEPHELIMETWTFRVYHGQELLAEKAFEVSDATDNSK